MDNIANKILENQVDALAERVSRLEADLAGLRKTPSTFKASGDRHQHRWAREDAITQARREKLLDRLDQADKSSKRTGRPLSEAWDTLSRD